MRLLSSACLCFAAVCCQQANDQGRRNSREAACPQQHDAAGGGQLGSASSGGVSLHQQRQRLQHLSLSEGHASEAVELWSEPATWGGGGLPAEDGTVTIGAGKTVMLDVDPPRLSRIDIQGGELIFDPTKDIRLDVTYVTVTGHGRLTIGTPSAPYAKRATVTLHGNRSTPLLSGMGGAKVIVAMDAVIEMHGAPRSHTWTRLAHTAAPGAASVTVKGHVDWSVGESIVVASSDFEMEHAEERTITGAASDGQNTVLHLDAPLAHQHFGDRQCWEGVCIDEVAEVILLSRNIVVQGDEGSAGDDGFGGHMMWHNHQHDGAAGTAYMRLSHVELRNMGQRGELARYPIHFHIPGDSLGGYVKGCSVHSSFNRAVTLHGVNNVTLEGNVAYDIEGHAIFLEDGNEKFNTIRGNVVMLTKPGSTISEDDTPASYWITNPMNFFYDNVAAGSGWSGFWFNLDRESAGDSLVCPRYEPLGAFEGNVAHSNFKYGFEVNPQWLPKQLSCDKDSADAPAVWRNLSAWKNGYIGVRFANEIGALTIDGLMAADNAKIYQTSSGIFYYKISASNGTVAVRNAIFVQLSNNNPFRREPVRKIRRGIHLPKDSDNLYIDSCTFVHYNLEGWAFDFFRLSKESHVKYYGWEVHTRNLRFINSTNRLHYRFAHQGVLADADGSFDGSAGPRRLAHASALYDPAKCRPAPAAATLPGPGEAYDELFHGKPVVSCDHDYRLRRLGPGELGQQLDQLWSIEGRAERLASHSSGGDFTVVAPTGVQIDVSFDAATGPGYWETQFAQRWMSPDEKILFRLDFNRTLANPKVTFDSTIATMLPSRPDVATIGQSGYFYDPSIRKLYVLFAMPHATVSVEAP